MSMLVVRIFLLIIRFGSFYINIHRSSVRTSCSSDGYSRRQVDLFSQKNGNNYIFTLHNFIGP
jgi:hypothetical protein